MLQGLYQLGIAGISIEDGNDESECECCVQPGALEFNKAPPPILHLLLHITPRQVGIQDYRVKAFQTAPRRPPLYTGQVPQDERFSQEPCSRPRRLHP
jgi:hypothetical protein